MYVLYIYILIHTCIYIHNIYICMCIYIYTYSIRHTLTYVRSHKKKMCAHADTRIHIITHACALHRHGGDATNWVQCMR